MTIFHRTKKSESGKAFPSFHFQTLAAFQCHLAASPFSLSAALVLSPTPGTLTSSGRDRYLYSNVNIGQHTRSFPAN